MSKKIQKTKKFKMNLKKSIHRSLQTSSTTVCNGRWTIGLKGFTTPLLPPQTMWKHLIQRTNDRLSESPSKFYYISSTCSFFRRYVELLEHSLRYLLETTYHIPIDMTNLNKYTPPQVKVLAVLWIPPAPLERKIYFKN